jgi:hypothetical protein
MKEESNVNARKTALVLAALALAGCSSLQTSTDFNPATDFSQFRSFSFKDVHPIRNTLLDSRLKDAVTSTLTSKGWTRTNENPDIWVVMHVRLSTQTQINTYSTGWGWGWGWGGTGMTTSTVQQIPVGTLVIDLVDTKAKELVWRGKASDTIDPNASPDKRDKNIRNALNKLFENFPPGQKPK